MMGVAQMVTSMTPTLVKCSQITVITVFKTNTNALASGLLLRNVMNKMIMRISPVRCARRIAEIMTVIATTLALKCQP